MAGRKGKSLIPGFSWRMALGITALKRKAAKVTGIPTTKSGRKAKLRKKLLPF